MDDQATDDQATDDQATVCCNVPRAWATATLATLTIALAGSGGGKLERKQFADVEYALRGAGLEICEYRPS
jgi:hypothetical protein